jgi:hypothetical protein
LRAGGFGGFCGHPRHAAFAAAGEVTVDELQMPIPSAEKAVNKRRQLARGVGKIVSVLHDGDRRVGAASDVIGASDRADRGAGWE